MNIGVQYYRPPFPEERYWEQDFKMIRDCGLNTVQLWVLWAWVEASPGGFCFDDYDRLMGLAEKNGLGVVLSAIGEIQPYWIHRIVPDSEMVNHLGHKVASSNREECHFGLTPGGCTDHPGVWERMKRFFETLALRYRSCPNLKGWDAWNELRWNVGADGMVCFCAHTLSSFREWLDKKYGGLEGLNREWKRRYSCWEDVMPGKVPDRPYTEMIAFESFLTARANGHARDRYRIIKDIDKVHPVTVHGGCPSPLYAGGSGKPALDRGNDWFFADALDGIGFSSFPKGGNVDDAGFSARVGYTRSAAGEKPMWLSELQGGRSAIGFEMHQPVDAGSQQRWVWSGISGGADTILFWCWRDEVFGRESSGFGISGNDGFSEERLAAMKKTGEILNRHSALFSSYRPAPCEVGVLFSPLSYYLYWAQEGTAGRALRSLEGYCRALVKNSIPYVVVEEEHLDVLSRLKVLFLPRTVVTAEKTEKALSEFVEGGGMLVCESECGAFTPEGIYRYPGDRFVAKLTGVREIGRRHIEDDEIQVKFGEETFNLGLRQWLTPLTPLEGDVFSGNDDGALVLRAPAGEGSVVGCGSYLGDAYAEKGGRDFEKFLRMIVVEAGFRRDVEILQPEASAFLQCGEFSGKKVMFLFAGEGGGEVHIRFNKGFLKGGSLKDVISGKRFKTVDEREGSQCRVNPGEWGVSVLVEESEG